MGDRKKDKKKREEERRKFERFAWLGPLMERRKAEPEPLENSQENDELEEVKE